MHSTDRSNRTGALTLAACLLIAPLAATAQPAGIDPEARKLLQASTSFLASQKQFSVSARNTIEVVLKSGQKLQYDSGSELVVQRPDRLRVERKGDLIDQVFYYDGKSLTLHNPEQKAYATVKAPDTLEAMLDYARETLDIVAPAGDLVYKNAFEILMQDVSSGFVVGSSMIDGTLCDHLAFRSPQADWQIWIQEGAQPLPRKFVITSRDVAGAPQFQVDMGEWNLAPDVKPEMFVFDPPKGVQKIDFLPLK